MKKKLLIGALVLIVITGAKPYAAKAQDKKEVKKTIIIRNGDTIINGKNLKEVSKAERKKLLKELDGAPQIELSEERTLRPNGNQDVQVIIRKKKGDGPEEVTVKHLKSPGAMSFHGDDLMMPRHFRMEGDSMKVNVEVDSILKTVRMHMDGLDSNMRQGFRVMKRGDDDFEFFVNPPNGAMAPRAGMVTPDGSVFRMGRPEGKNSQAFSYANTDKEGISNRLNIRLGETGKETLKKITGSETPKADLNVQDLNIFPSFSAGKLNVAFSLKTKGAVELKILDSDYQAILTDKQTNFNESYYKSINLPKNGVYYLAINQNGNWYVKRMVKE